MRTTTVTLPELALVAATRGMAGAGAGLLVADRIGGEKRKTLGWTLFLIGVLSTIPLALQVFGKRT
jgi:hypothetical protein